MDQNEETHTNDEEPLMQPILIAQENQFHALKTVPAFSIHLLISTLISCIGILLAISWPDNKRCEAYFIMLYLRGAFWFVTLILDYHTKHRHEQLRLNGYHDFTKKINVHKGIPIYLVSLYNSTILFVQALMQQYYGDHFGEACLQSFFTPLIYITLFNISENIILGMVNGSYISKVRKFNSSAPVPDALHGLETADGFLGVAMPDGNVQELLEKQADLISLLKDHNSNLCERMMQLSTQINGGV